MGLPALCGARVVIVVTPNVPVAGDLIRIEVVTAYGHDASIRDAKISRIGNRIFIEQTIDSGCILFSAPVLRARFDVGPLAAGGYEVNVRTQKIDFLPVCSALEVDLATFIVAGPPLPIPSNSRLANVLIGLLISGLVIKKFRDA